MTQEELAKLLRVSLRTVVRYERGGASKKDQTIGGFSLKLGTLRALESLATEKRKPEWARYFKHVSDAEISPELRASLGKLSTALQSAFHRLEDCESPENWPPVRNAFKVLFKGLRELEQSGLPPAAQSMTETLISEVENVADRIYLRGRHDLTDKEME